MFTLEMFSQRNEIINPRISSLQVVAGEDWLSPPITTLNGDEPINISFDDLTHTYHRYVFKIQHCEADWTPSDGLFENDYIEGFFSGNTIDDYEESLNTNVQYNHYKLQIPNNRCRIKMSGNYKLTVYDDDNDNEEMFTACFMIVDPQMTVAANVNTNTDIDINNSHQQLSMQVNYNSVNVTDPSRQIKTVVMQNGRWDNAKINAKPQYIMTTGLKWEHNKDLIFQAGNEYHKFEILDVHRNSMGVDQIVWDGKDFNIKLYPDVPRNNYVYDEDANGSFYIRNSDNVENDKISEYVLVHFLLQCPEKADGDVYLNGAWTNDQFIPKYRMEYDEMNHCYNGVVQLKLGYYSYQYLLMRDDGSVEVMPTEGSFFQTENKYQILVYYRDNSGRTDNLVGYQKIDFK